MKDTFQMPHFTERQKPWERWNVNGQPYEERYDLIDWNGNKVISILTPRAGTEEKSKV